MIICDICKDAIAPQENRLFGADRCNKCANLVFEAQEKLKKEYDDKRKPENKRGFDVVT